MVLATRCLFGLVCQTGEGVSWVRVFIRVLLRLVVDWFSKPLGYFDMLRNGMAMLRQG